MILCDACYGKKMILGLGGIAKECDKCCGTGFISSPDDKKTVLGEPLKAPKCKRKKSTVNENIL